MSDAERADALTPEQAAAWLQDIRERVKHAQEVEAAFIVGGYAKSSDPWLNHIPFLLTQLDAATARQAAETAALQQRCERLETWMTQHFVRPFYLNKRRGVQCEACGRSWFDGAAPRHSASCILAATPPAPEPEPQP